MLDHVVQRLEIHQLFLRDESHAGAYDDQAGDQTEIDEPPFRVAEVEGLAEQETPPEEERLTAQDETDGDVEAHGDDRCVERSRHVRDVGEMVGEDCKLAKESVSPSAREDVRLIRTNGQ